MLEDPLSYWDGIALRDAARPVADPAAFHDLQERVRSFMRPTDHVLELGSGTGAMADKLARHVARYHCTDASGAMVDLARNRLQWACRTHVRCAVARVGAPDLPQDQDMVLALDLLHLLDNVPDALRQIHALIRPGGYFIAKTPCFTGPAMTLRLPLYLAYLSGRAPRITMMRPETLERMVRSAGFGIVSCEALPRGSRNILIVAQVR